MTETEIAQELEVDQSTISRDIKVLKELSQRFVYDLAKSDLSYYYKQSIDGIEEAKREAWRIYHHNNNQVSVKEKLSALKLIVEANESRFKIVIRRSFYTRTQVTRREVEQNCIAFVTETSSVTSSCLIWTLMRTCAAPGSGMSRSIISKGPLALETWTEHIDIVLFHH